MSFQAFPLIFEGVHGFNVQSTGLSFCGVGLGMILGLCTQPFWNRYVIAAVLKSGNKLKFLRVNDKLIIKHNGHPPPEGR
jgi:hypothetical protein